MEYKTMHRTLLGHVNVDSGQLMVTDPCYLTNFINNDFNPKTKYMNVRDNKKIVVHPDDFFNYEDDMIKGYNKNMNTLINEGVFVKLEDDKIDSSYSYVGCCHQTSKTDKQGGVLASGLGVAFTSGWGDGSYPVYAHYEDNRIKKIEIEFFTDEEDDDAI